MYSTAIRPRITDYARISDLVLHLRKEGVTTDKMAKRIMKIGLVDLDMLKVVLRIL